MEDVMIVLEISKIADIRR